MDTDDIANAGETDSTITTDVPPAVHQETGPVDALGPTVEGEPGETWSPPKIEPETGIALDGHGLPVNHRLRAERLAEAGETEDPAGEVSAELIADAGERVAAQREADEERSADADEANPPVSANMKVAALERIAKKQGIDISSAANNDERVAMIEAARASGAAKPANEGGR